MSEKVAHLLARVAGLVAGATVRSREFVPDGRQRIYFANHTSHLDAIVVWSVLPPEVRRLTRPVAARDYWEANPLRRYLAGRVFNAVLIERQPEKRTSNAVDDMLAGMGDHHSLILFPEGTRGTGDAIQPFKSGIYRLASRKPGIELVPVYIENLNRILPKGEVVPIPLLSSVALGRPLVLADGEGKEAFLERARASLEALR